MIGRNDPCLCGSGKKYKKCCEGKQQVTAEKVFIEEIELVLQTFYTMYPERKDIMGYVEIVNEWSPSLIDYIKKELIEAIAIEEFFYHKRLDIWQGYLKRTIKKTIRPAMLQLLDTWHAPKMFVGEVIEVEERYFKAHNPITEEMVYIRRESNRPIPEGMQVYAFILPDGSGEKDYYLAVSTLIFFPANYKEAVTNYVQAFKKSAMTPEEFFKNHHFDFWKMLVEAGYRGEEYTTFEIEVVQQVKQFLAEKQIEAKSFVNLLEDYLVEKKPKARKAAGIAAGSIRFAQENNLLNGASFTVKEIAEYFGVSASSLNKYYQELGEYNESLVK